MEQLQLGWLPELPLCSLYSHILVISSLQEWRLHRNLKWGEKSFHHFMLRVSSAVSCEVGQPCPGVGTRRESAPCAARGRCWEQGLDWGMIWTQGLPAEVFEQGLLAAGPAWGGCQQRELRLFLIHKTFGAVGCGFSGL